MYPKETNAILAWMFPNANPGMDWELLIHPDGVEILAWHLAVPQPTQVEVEQEELAWARWKRKTDARRDIETYIDSEIQPVTRSMLRDGEPIIDAATGEAVREFIADCYSAVNAFDDAVDLATLENINTVAVDLPAYVGPAQ